MDEQRRERWERASEWPLTGTALAFLVSYATVVLRTDLGAGWRSAADVVAVVAWAAFAVDYGVRLALSRSRWEFARRHPLDLAVVVLPLLRPLRLLRLVMLLTVLNRRAGRSVRGRVAVYLVGATSLVVLVASLAVLDSERGHPDATITSFGDALWWSSTTVTTVGYGDRFPVTDAGRLVAVALMVAGIALLGTVTATFASYLVERVREVEEESQVATRRDVRDLAAEVTALRAELAERHAEQVAAGSAPGR